ncbi:MAG: NUDIX domain-containing protein [Pseudomonadota bacterium]
MLHPWFRLTRGLTLGVRVLVRNPQGEILLVRHTYAPGWLLPGGGVERGEIAEEAAAREVMEEAGVHVALPLKLFSVYSNAASFEGDHVLLYLGQTTDEVSQKGNLEIAEARFFLPTDLPEGTTAGTKRRVRELLDATPADSQW